MRRTDKIICKSLITTFAKKTLRYLFKRYNNANGQVLVEYVLFSILVLAIMGAFMKAFSEANVDYLGRVFGGGERDYLGCLLREGQLPRLGAQAGPGACPIPTFKFEGNVPEYPVPAVSTAPRLSDAVIPPAPNLSIGPDIPRPPPIPPPPNLSIGPDIPRPPPIPPPPNLSSGPNTSSFAGNKGVGEGRGLSEGIGGGRGGGIVPINKAAGARAGDLGGGNQFYLGQGRNLSRKAGALIPIKSKKNNAKKSLFGGTAIDDSNNIRRNNIQGSRVRRLSDRERQELAANTQTAIFQQGIGSAFKKRVIPLAENKLSGAPVEDEPWSWDFGALIKYLVIIVVILLILFLLGGQFAQIKKGLEGAR